MSDLFHRFSGTDTQAKTKNLRPHQIRAIDLLKESLKAKNKRVVIQGPTGFGKTLTAAKIIEGALAKGNRVIFTAPEPSSGSACSSATTLNRRPVIGWRMCLPMTDR